MNRFFVVFSALLLSTSGLSGRELLPWFGNNIEFEWRTDYTFQAYDQVDRGGGSTSRSSSDNFLNMSLVISPLPDWSFEMESLVGSTEETSSAYHLTRGTVRYQLFNDVIGDCFSTVVGVSGMIPTSSTRRDIGTPWYGDIAGEVHLSIGKEYSLRKTWSHRGWGVVLAGLGQGGAPWLGSSLAWEKNFWDCQRVRIFADGLWGWGPDSLNLTQLSHDVYREINYQSIDVGLRYIHEVFYWGALSFQYSYRVYARNYPVDNHRFSVEVLRTFGI